jgi:hypothetical protein
MHQDSSPFQVLTLIVAPALLTNASALLSFSTSNRFARVVDRSRYLYEKLKSPEHLQAEEKKLYQTQLPLLSHRAKLLMYSLNCYYVSVGAFSATALTSIIGAVVIALNPGPTEAWILWLSLFFGALGVSGLMLGTALMVREMKSAVTFLNAEITLTKRVLDQYDQGKITL